MTEFEKAKKRYEKKQQKVQQKAAEVVPIRKDPPKPRDSVSVVIMDDGVEYKYFFELAGIRQTRIASQRNGGAYQQLLEALISKEFGRWQLRPTP